MNLRSLSPVLALALLLLASACSGGHSGTSAPGTPAASTTLLRMEVATPGLVHVTYEDLQAAGFASGPLALGTLQITNLGQSVAFRAVSVGGTALEAGDSLDFYAQAVDTEFTGINVFWLSAAGTPAAMATRDGSVSGTPTPRAVFQDTLVQEANNLMFLATPDAPEADHWFWLKLTAPDFQGFSFRLAGLDETAGDSVLEIELLGATSVGLSPDHHVQVGLNGTQVADLTWSGITVESQAVTIPAGLLAAGLNTLTLTLPGDTGAAVDAVLLNSFRIVYWRPLKASGDTLAFTLPADTALPVKVSGFLNDDVLLVDITDPLKAAFVTPTTGLDDGGTYHLLFQDSTGAAASYLALTSDQEVAPSALDTWEPGALREATAGADYLLITPRAFLDAAEPLRQFRESQGLRARSVAVEDIYNEFAYGFPDPAAIKAFLAHAAANWVAPAPAYVLLLGDATYDYRDRMGTGKLSRVPCHLSLTEDLGLTPDDNWFAALDGMDSLPSLKIGRLPAASAAQAARVAQKLIAYESAPTPPSSKVLLVADNNDRTFPDLCDELADLLPSTLTPTRIYLENYTDFRQCALDIEAALDEGMLLTTYNGHGDVSEWAGERVFNAASVPLLTNGSSLTFALVLNCENGFFAKPGGYCLAESLVGAEGRGAIGALASSGLGYESDHALLGKRFFQLFLAGGNARIGDICAQAKILAYGDGAAEDLLRIMTLIGDPAMRVRMPQ